MHSDDRDRVAELVNHYFDGDMEDALSTVLAHVLIYADLLGEDPEVLIAKAMEKLQAMS